MIREEITLAGKPVTLGYCYATEIAYKDLSGEDITDIIQETIACVNAQPARMPDAKRSICLVLASHAYSEDDYIRNYDEFLEYVGKE